MKLTRKGFPARKRKFKHKAHRRTLTREWLNGNFANIVSEADLGCARKPDYVKSEP